MSQVIRSVGSGRAACARLLTVTTFICGALIAGCGGAHTPAPARVRDTATAPPAAARRSAQTNSAPGAGTRSSAAAGHGGATSTTASAPAGAQSAALAFAKCMRANGVPDFPDPSAGNGATFGVSAASGSSPATATAQAKCRRLLPVGGLPGSGAPASAQTLAKLVAIARCMRDHGVPQFPDPRTSMPSNLTRGEYQVITDYDGAILLFPRTLNLMSPAYRTALVACGAPPLGLPH